MIPHSRYAVPRPPRELLEQADTRFEDHCSTAEFSPRTRLEAARNAVLLANVLAEWSYGPVEICNGTVRPRSKTSNQSSHLRNEHRARARIHYWVEVTVDETGMTYLCDLCPPVDVRSCATQDVQETCLVTGTKPAEYQDSGGRWSLDDLHYGKCPDELLLWDAVFEARRWGESYCETAEDSESPLESNCFDLAGHLLEQLAPLWPEALPSWNGRADCYVMRGGIRSSAYDPDEQVTVREIERGGQIHFWVEATTAGTETRYVCDAWSRVPDAYGEPLVSCGRPANYIPASNGRVQLSEVEQDRHWADPVV